MSEHALPGITVQDLMQLNTNEWYEVVHGELIRKISPSYCHALLIKYLFKLLDTFVEETS